MNRKFSIDEARKIGNQLSVDWELIDIGQFLLGMNIEAEYALLSDKTEISVKDALFLGRMVKAHLNQNPEYYLKLEKLEFKKSADTVVDLSHYYGNRVRQIFFACAAVMLIGLPFVKDALAVPAFFSVVAILLLDFLAALTNPKQKWINTANTVTAALGLVIFEFLAIKAFGIHDALFFVINQFLALMFLVALYFNTKTLRAMLLN